MSPSPARILGVVGLKAEARLLRRHGIEAVVGGGDAEALARKLGDRLLKGCAGVLSFGVAGGLSPELKAGDLVLATRVLDLTRGSGAALAFDADAAWAAALQRALPDAHPGPIAGVCAPVATPAGKAALFQATGAIAADMESHIAAEAAARCGLAFAVVRAISDSAPDALPRAALAGMRPDGGTDTTAVLSALLRRPYDLLALLRTAGGFGAAMRRLSDAVPSLR